MRTRRNRRGRLWLVLGVTVAAVGAGPHAGAQDEVSARTTDSRSAACASLAATDVGVATRITVPLAGLSAGEEVTVRAATSLPFAVHVTSAAGTEWVSTTATRSYQYTYTWTMATGGYPPTRLDTWFPDPSRPWMSDPNAPAVAWRVDCAAPKANNGHHTGDDNGNHGKGDDANHGKGGNSNGGGRGRRS